MTKDNRKELNILLHEYLRLRDGERCLRCGKTDRLQLSHIYSKGKYRKMEFEEDNVKLLCVGCHLYWWHKSPIEAFEWLEATISPERLKRLKLRANINDKSILDYKLIKLYFENKIQEYD